MMRTLVFGATLTFILQFFSQNGFTQNVGIGTPTPIFKLDVRNGSINTDSGYRIRSNMVLFTKDSSSIFVGVNSGINNTGGGSNTAIGHASLYLNATGSGNVAVGESALYFQTDAIANTGCGYGALRYNTDWFNTACGYNALGSNTTGRYNVACGAQAATLNTVGLYNTAIGAEALRITTASDGNTAVGYHAANKFNNGFYNTYIGIEADASGPGLYNSVALGGSATVTASLQVRIGNSLITSIGGYQDWSTISDGRYKQNIQENVKGLEFIMKLRPITYNLDVSTISKKLNESRGREILQLMKNAINEKEKIIYTGFIAQEVEKAAMETGYDFSGVDKPKNENDFYGLRYAQFVTPLIKAVQEQQQQVERLTADLNMKEIEFNNLKKRIEQLEKIVAQVRQ